MMDSAMFNYVRTGWAVFFVAAFVGLCWRAVLDTLLASRSRTWPDTIGTVQSSCILVGKSRAIDSAYTTYVHRARITYDFFVDGRRYVSDRIGAAFPMYGGETEAKRVLREYQRGKSVRVYYDPSTPSIAMLKRGLTPELLRLPFIALICLISAGAPWLIFG